MVTDHDPGGLLDPGDTCSKTRRPVIEILREKLPKARIFSEDSFNEHPDAEGCLETMPTFCYEYNVPKCAADLTGGVRHE